MSESTIITLLQAGASDAEVRSALDVLAERLRDRQRTLYRPIDASGERYVVGLTDAEYRRQYPEAFYAL